MTGDATRTSHTLRKAKRDEAIGQLGGHIQRGVPHPRGERTGKPMALLSALPLAPDSDKLVLTFLDRSDPVETFDYQPDSGDNAVVIADRDEVVLSTVKGVCHGDWRGIKVAYDREIVEPTDLDVDPTGLDMEASDAWVDLVDELGCDCTKLGGYPVWTVDFMDMEAETGRPLVFHHRVTGDLLDISSLGEGPVVYVFVDPSGGSGAVCWQRSGGGSEVTYQHFDDRDDFIM